MTFYDIAIHDGCMTGLQLCGNLVFIFDPIKTVQVLSLYRETIPFQILSPTITAASGRQLVDRYQPALFNCYTGSARNTGSQEQRSKYHHQQYSSHTFISFYISPRLNSWAFKATMTVLRDMNNAPTAGESRIPNGASTPAANGRATRLYPVAQIRFWIIFR